MTLTKRTKEDGSPFWACETTISERHVPKAAKFKWSGNFWWTDDIKVAAKLKEFADAECKDELEAVKVNSRSAAKVEAMKAAVEAEKAKRIQDAADREAQRMAQAAIWQKQREQTAKAKQDYIKSIHTSPFIIQGNTYTIKEDLRALGCKWDADRKGWVALDEDTFKAGKALLGEHEKEHPTIMRWYHEGGAFEEHGPDKFYVGELLRHEGAIWAVEKAWSTEWEGDDWNRHANLRPATAEEKAKFLENEAEARRELVKTTATSLQERAMENIFDAIAKQENYLEPKMLKGDNGYEYPEHISLEGEKINIGEGANIYGGGKWFVLAEDKVWAVANNGHDGDCWAYNNIRTGGAGAIGYCVPRTEELVGEIRHAAEVSNFLGKAEEVVAQAEATKTAREEIQASGEGKSTDKEEVTPERKQFEDMLETANQGENSQGEGEAERE